MTATTKAGWTMFECVDCGNKYKHKGSLQRHIKYECRKQPSFKCPYCVYRAYQKHNLLLHERHLHKDLPEKVEVLSEWRSDRWVFVLVFFFICIFLFILLKKHPTPLLLSKHTWLTPNCTKTTYWMILHLFRYLHVSMGTIFVVHNHHKSTAEYRPPLLLF